jgi:hypothetical protein
MSIIPMVFTSNPNSRPVLGAMALGDVNFYRFLMAGWIFDGMKDAGFRGKETNERGDGRGYENL